MRNNATCVFRWLAIAAIPFAAFARSSGPPVNRTGVLADGGLTCTVCHVQSGEPGTGRVSISASSYTPGVKQTITITIEDPAGQRWGFQLTARVKSDQAKQAGTFTVNPDTRVQCGSGGDAPCNGATEFASHTSASTRPGTPSPGVFKVEWTPPSSDLGDVILYAAANAANNSNSPIGDHIYTTNMTISAAACNVSGNPTVTGVMDAANVRGTITSNELISVYGSGFAGKDDSFQVGKNDLQEGKLPISSFRCVAVEVAGKRAPLLYIGEKQINAQAPFIDVSGDVDVRVILNPGTPNEVRSSAGKARAAVYAPAFFTFDGKSISARNGSRDNSIVGNPAVVAGGAPAKPGDVVVLYGTGFGFSEPVYQPGEFATAQAWLRDPYTVTMGGVTLASADILYAGLSGDAPGLYQFNVRVPANLPDGDTPVVVRIGGAETQAGASIPIQR